MGAQYYEIIKAVLTIDRINERALHLLFILFLQPGLSG